MPKYLNKTCSKHGLTSFVLEGRGYYRCRKCRGERVAARRKRVKQILVVEAGGKCSRCGYSKCIGALEFHHTAPSEKSYGLSERGLTKGIATLRKEAAKCVLLCANCHREIEDEHSGLA